MIRPARLVPGIVAALLCVALSTLAAPTALAQASPPTEDEIFSQLGVDSVPADYVVLVDTSTSMQGDRYDRVRSTLFPFIAGTSKADHVAIYTFDSTVVPRYIGPGGDAGSALAGLPAAPDGETDIGGAISAALDELGRAGAAEVGSIVLLTDGVNAPPAGSPYADVTGPAWAALKDRAAKLAGSGRAIHGYSLPLTSDAEGAQLLRQVLPDTTLVSPSGVPDIAAFLDRTKRAVKVEQAKRVVGTDIGRGVAVEWPVQPVVDMASGHATMPVTLRSLTKKVPLTVAGVNLRADGAPAGVAVLDPVSSLIELGPGQSTTLTVQLSWDPGAGVLPYERTARLDCSLTVDAAVSSSWAAPLKDAGIDLGVPAAPAGATSTCQLERTVGYAWVLPAAAALLVLLVALLLVRRYLRRNPRVGEQLYATRVTTTDTRTVELRRGPTEFTLPADGPVPGQGTVRPIRIPGGDPGLEITFSPDGSEARRRTEVLHVAAGGAITISGVEFSLQPPLAAQPMQRA